MARPDREDQSGAATTPLERVLAALWAHALDLPEVPVTETFRRLGGNTTIAVALAEHVRQALGVGIAPDALFASAATVREMAVRVTDARHFAGASSISRSRADGPVPLSSGQYRLWLFDQFMPGDPCYHVALAYWLDGPVDVNALGTAVAGLFARHEVLRTRFEAPDGIPVQMLRAEHTGDMRVEDVAGPATERRTRALALATAEVRRPFDLASGPHARTLLLQIDAAAALLVLTIHHVAVDGWSVPVLLRDLAELYRAARERRPARLPEITTGYRDYAVWQRDWLRTRSANDELEWWRGQLASVSPVLPLPTDRPRPLVAVNTGSTVDLGVPAPVLAALRQLSNGHGATLFIVLLTAVGAMLAAEAGTSDIVCAVPSTGRARSEWSETVGFFINMLPVRVDCSGDPDFSTLLGRARDAALGAYSHTRVPFELLVREFDLDRDLSRSPLAQVMVQIEADDAVLDLPEVTATRVGNLEGGARFDLEFHFHDGPRGLWGELVYATDLFDVSSARRFAHRTELILAWAAEDASRSLSSCPVQPADG